MILIFTIIIKDILIYAFSFDILRDGRNSYKVCAVSTSQLSDLGSSLFQEAPIKLHWGFVCILNYTNKFIDQHKYECYFSSHLLRIFLNLYKSNKKETHISTLSHLYTSIFYKLHAPMIGFIYSI